MNNDFAMGTFWDGAETKIADRVDTTFYHPDFNYDEIHRMVKTIVPIYKDAVEFKGFAPYELGVPEGIPTLKYVQQQAGYERNMTNFILTTIENMAKGGEIDIKYWNPKAGAEVQKQPSAAEKALAPVAAQVGKTVETTFNKVLITGAIVGIVYLLGKELLKGVVLRK